MMFCWFLNEILISIQFQMICFIYLHEEHLFSIFVPSLLFFYIFFIGIFFYLLIPFFILYQIHSQLQSKLISFALLVQALPLFGLLLLVFVIPFRFLVYMLHIFFFIFSFYCFFSIYILISYF